MAETSVLTDIGSVRPRRNPPGGGMMRFLRWLIAELPPTDCPACTGLRETNPHGICGGCYYAQQDDGIRTPLAGGVADRPSRPRVATPHPRPVTPATRTA